MPSSTKIWVPYPTAENPLIWPDLYEWDSIQIGSLAFPIEGVPKYERHLSADPKKPKGSDYYSITSHGIKPSPIHITLKLWVDVSTGKNYLDMYRDVLPELIPPRLSKRFSVAIYHPALAGFGVSSVVFTKTSTPQPVGGLVFHAELEAIDARDVKDGQSQKEKKKPSSASLAAAGQEFGPPDLESPRAQQIRRVTAPILEQMRVAELNRTRAQVAGFFESQAMQGKLNTPASRSGAP